MRTLTGHTIRQVGSVVLVTLLLTTLMMLSVDLFTNLDSYLTGEVKGSLIAILTLLGTPQALLFALGPSTLFAVSYFLSQLEANNEMICLYGCGVSYRRLIIPILLLGLVLSAAQFTVAEAVQIPAQVKRQQIEDGIFGLRSTHDSRNLTISDPQGRYVVWAKYYNDRELLLSEVVLLLLDEGGSLAVRIDADRARWNPAEHLWVLENTRIQEILSDQGSLAIRSADLLRLPEFSIEPSYFKNISDDIKTMELSLAIRYLATIKALDQERYHPLATDFIKRLYDSLNPLLLTIIAVTISYRYKKNILLFSIITSLSVAVIFYVVQMVTLILARQAVIGPLWAMAIPTIVLLFVAFAERAIIGRRS
ncbi:MAG: LptF/LptG family permease [Sphaerochaeta sp.]